MWHFVFLVFGAVFFTASAFETPTKAINESTGCALPDFPANGNYSVSNTAKALVKGDLVEPFTVLTYTCNQGYEASDKFSICKDDNTWTTAPGCNEYCRMISSTSVNFDCFSETNEAIPCQPNMPAGSIVRSNCKKGHTEIELLDDVKCLDGRWDNPFPKCKANCGYLTSSIDLTLPNGNSTERFPWHVLIFEERSSEIEQICSGNLIQPDIVISAAHCFFDVVAYKLKPAGLYRVAAGKTNRLWDDKEIGRNVQTSEIEEITLHANYGGDEQNQRSDLSIVRLKTQLKLSTSIMPVCYDLVDQAFDDFQTRAGNLGKIMSLVWTEAGVPSGEIKTISFPVVDLKTCTKELSKYRFNRYLTTDKLCAGYINGTTLCVGDSGAGLVFPAQQYDGSVRWFLRATSSIGPLNDDKTSCRRNTYTALSHVFRLRDWLRKELKRLGY